jgi:lysophospholipase L1-like esterase
LLLAMLLGVEGPHRASAFDTYLALGDSLAFGESLQDGTPSTGDRGYVSLFADALGAARGGARPDVVNLAVDGETTSTFFSRGTDPHLNTPVPGYPSYSLNTHYDGRPAASQSDLFASTAQGLAASGHSIDTVTMQIGSNDFLQYAYDSSGNPRLPTASEVANATQALSTNMVAILSEIKTLAPSANVYVLGYYDPYKPLLGSSDPAQAQFATAAQTMTSDLNAFLQALAGNFGASFVDVASTVDPFTQTRFFDPSTPGNVHPTAEGYQAIARAIETVPEPGSLMLSAVGLSGIALAARRHARRG